MTMVDGEAPGRPQAEVLRLLSSDDVAVAWGIPCAARPAAGLVHLDGPCGCFCGGPPPVYAPRPRMH
ncbi:hypothetical protein [uncultured Cellulomonas sp.]|uniref:hypothetical protein n=1 Tax=uncultured Cellulomonas sp. TaxID=189682 RepID=UPI0026078DB2|nr:hypothetical protein [uncultured Cellulomonas sp.]